MLRAAMAQGAGFCCNQDRSHSGATGDSHIGHTLTEANRAVLMWQHLDTRPWGLQFDHKNGQNLRAG
jgi:hypothetical protein